MAALIALPYLGLVATDVRCSSRWSMAGMTDVTFRVPPCEKKSVVSLKTYDWYIVTASACERTAVRSRLLLMRSGVALCPPRSPFLGLVLVWLVLWVSCFPILAPPFPTPSLWVRGWAQRPYLRPIRSLFLVAIVSVLTRPLVGNGYCSYLSYCLLVAIVFSLCYCLPVCW